MAKESTANPTPELVEEQTATKPQRLIYCGPSIPNSDVSNGKISKGGLPVHLDKLFTDCPAVKALFVPISELAKTQKALAVKGTPENALFNEVLQFARKRGK